MEPLRATLSNEFASVRIEVNNDAKGPRLQVTDLASGASVYLDPFELECLAWTRHEHLTHMVKPSYREERAAEIVNRQARRAALSEAEDVLRRTSSD